MKNKAGHRILSILLTLVLLWGGLPVTAFAADGGDTPPPDGEVGTATPGTTKQADVTFTIAEGEYGTAFYLPEGVAVTDADLLAGVTAVDENGGPVTVTLKDTDGQDLANPQMRGAYPNPPYVITYAAVHPVSGDEYTETRELYVTLGVGAIMPMAATLPWSGAAPDISAWLGDNNVITVAGTNATGTLTIPDGVTKLKIDGGTGATITGQIVFANRTNPVELTLKNVTINSDSYNNGAIYKSISAAGGLTLVIEGTVTLKGSNGTTASSALYFEGANLTITGTGTLNATGGNASATTGGNGIWGNSSGSDLTVASGCTVYATGGDGGGGGVYASFGDIINDQGGTITATGGGDSTGGTGGAGGNGINVYSGNIINNSGGTITATGGSGNQSGADGQAATGTVTGTIMALPTVTFAAQGSVNLQNPTDIVFQESPAGSLSIYSFVSVRFENAAGSGYTFYPGAVTGLAYNSTSGELTIPQAAFGLPGVLSLSSGSYNTIITFGDNQNNPTYTFDYTCGLTLTGVTVPPTPTPTPAPQSSGRKSSGGSGNTGTRQATAPTPVTKQDALDAFNKALASLKPGQTTVNVRFVNCASIPLDVLKALADAAKKAGVTVIIHADTVSDGAVQTRLYIDPAKSAKEITLAAAIDSPDAVNAAIRFKSWFKNKLTAFSTGQQGGFGQPVKIAIKVDLTGMDTENLVFYSYDKSTNTYKPIKTKYWIDDKGYLHFTTELAGDIIISDGELEPKGQK